MINGVLQAGGFETRFRRAGVGIPVVVVSASGCERYVQGLERLARYSRVLLVLMPAEVSRRGEPALHVWLRGVIDGLGLRGPVLIVDSDLAEAVLRFARSDPDRVGGLVIVGVGSAGDDDHEEGVLALLKASAGGAG